MRPPRFPRARSSEEQAVGGILYVNVDTSLNLSHAASETSSLRDALHGAGLSDALVTGPPALQHDITPILTSDLHRGEILAALLALLLLVAVLGTCWAILIPYLVAGATTAGTLSVLFLLAHHFLMVLYVSNVIELIGLALAIDYSLLMVHRFRTEVTRDHVSVDEAIIATMNSAGRTVVLSGAAVAIGLATLLIVPVPAGTGHSVPAGRSWCRSSRSPPHTVGLQPALLSILGRRGVQAFGVGVSWLVATSRPDSSPQWPRRVIRRPVLVLVTSTALLCGASVSIFWLQLTPASVSAIPQNIQAAHALTLVGSRVGPGAITSIEIIVDTRGEITARQRERRRDSASDPGEIDTEEPRDRDRRHRPYAAVRRSDAALRADPRRQS